MKYLFENQLEQQKRRIWQYSLLMLVTIFLTACGFSPGGWRNFFQAQEPISTATDAGIPEMENPNSGMETKDVELITTTSLRQAPSKTNTPSLTASNTATSTFIPSLTLAPTLTFTNTIVYFQPPNTQIPATNTQIPPSNTPVPSSSTPKPTDTIVTEQPTQEPTGEPIENLTEEPTEPPACYLLIITHEGEGSDPVVSPKHSEGCPIYHYFANASISLSNAIPAARWEIEGWFGTLNPLSVEERNNVSMPANDHTAGVTYRYVG